jgi:transposase InsO family protein
LTDHSSRPRSSPTQLPRRTERRIVASRFTRRWGPHRIVYHLRLHRSTVGGMLAGTGCRCWSTSTNRRVCPCVSPSRYATSSRSPGSSCTWTSRSNAGSLIGGGWRIHGRGSAQDRKAGVVRTRDKRAGAAGSRGYRYLHRTQGDRRRGSGNAFFAGIGVNVTAVMTDNGASYRSHAFAAALGDIKHKWTRPYGPHTNGKVERFHRTLAAEWAYAATYDSDDARAATYQNWLHHYNHHRPYRHRPPDSPRSQPTREVGLAVQIAFLVAAKHPRS